MDARHPEGPKEVHRQNRRRVFPPVSGWTTTAGDPRSGHPAVAGEVAVDKALHVYGMFFIEADLPVRAEARLRPQRGEVGDVEGVAPLAPTFIWVPVTKPGRWPTASDRMGASRSCCRANSTQPRPARMCPCRQ